MKLLYFGDKHERVSTPENRLDDYRETQKAKSQEIIYLGKTHGVNAFLQPGDFFDTSNVPSDFASEVFQTWTGINMYEIMSKFMSGEISQEEVMIQLKSYIPMIGVAGNHELIGNNIRSLQKTTIGLMNRMGLMQFATKENPYYFYTDDGLKVAVTGTHYHLDIDHPEWIERDYVVTEKLGDKHIHIVHGMLSDKDMGKYIRHTLLDQIKHTKADLTISGHDHIGFPLTEIDGKWFVNTGGIMRSKNDLKEMNRKPKVLLIDITKAHGMQLQEIYLKSAQDGTMVLNRKKIEERKKREARLEEYKKAVRDAGMKQATDITEIIRDLSDTKAVDVSIKNDLLDRITHKKKEMDSIEETDIKEAVVEKIILENFQSHAYTELPFDKGFNIFVGESKQGKTAVLRAFDWVYENKPAGKRIVRKGTDYAKVTLFLSNGYIISRVLELTGKRRNGYEITDPNTGEVAYHNTKGLPEVQKLLGFTQFVIDKDLQFNLNFMKQGTGWFLIGDHFSAPQKAKVIGGIYGTQFADSVVRELDSEERKVNDKMKTANTELQGLDIKIVEYDYLTDVEKAIAQTDKLLAEIEQLESKRNRIMEVMKQRDIVQTQLKETEDVLRRLHFVETAELHLQSAQLQMMKREQIQSAYEQHKDLSHKYQILRETLVAVKDIEQARREFTEWQLLVNRSIAIHGLVADKQHLNQQIQIENTVLQQTNHIPKASSLYQEVSQNVLKRREVVIKLNAVTELVKEREAKLKSYQNIQETIEKTEQNEQLRIKFEELMKLQEKQLQVKMVTEQRQQIQRNLQSEIRNVEKQDKETKTFVQQYQVLLEEAGKCPVCYGTIDKATVNRIVSEFQY